MTSIWSTSTPSISLRQVWEALPLRSVSPEAGICAKHSLASIRGNDIFARGLEDII